MKPDPVRCATCLAVILADWRTTTEGRTLTLRNEDGSVHHCHGPDSRDGSWARQMLEDMKIQFKSDGTRPADAGDGASPRRSTGHNEDKGE